ncbi:DUF1847 domain-containing protein [Geobacter argillaceus]|uniref:Putative metal-binding protein n=1 Tax=Geobacter argillaceus TaxID=345631 RepID=A0A562VFF8_9BACT|nr:DUF1847 domain-containing protein [Geobacter argillaceus]TWJ16578.1 putative metal-binding protein [Geobacter argillaceus]
MERSGEETPLSCSKCSAVWQKNGTTNCWSGDPATAPPRPGYCPANSGSEIIDASLATYTGDSEDARLALMAAKVEGLCYQKTPGSSTVTARWTRVEDTVALAKLMGWKKIGIATCIGLLAETDQLMAILTGQGLEPLSVCCKAGSVDKLRLGLSEEDKVRPGTFEPACNPIAQAELCNRAGTDMNIIVGLCVGHDMLFTKHSQAPVTTLICKDRVTGHNPVAALYGQNFYYKRLQKVPLEVE